MEKFQNRYRTSSTRASWWDYANAGAYFIMNCSAGRICLFGETKNAEMILSPIREIVHHEWIKSFEMRAARFKRIRPTMASHTVPQNPYHRSSPDSNPLPPNG